MIVSPPSTLGSPPTTPALPEPAARCGDVVCRLVDGVSSLTRSYSSVPIKLLTPTPIGRAACVVVSSYGGGMVAGDVVPIHLDIHPGAACVLMTQASSKVYKSDGRMCRQSITAGIGDGGLLAMLPDPLCCFADARYQQTQRFDLSPQANLIWLDWATSGRWARGERWAFDSFSTRTDVRVNDRLLLRETLSLEASDGPIGGAMRMGRFDCYAVMVLVGPKVGPLVRAAEEAVAGWPVRPRSETLASVSPIDGGAVLRLLGPSAQHVQSRLRQILSPLKDLIGGDPWARKW